jgi:hypothetical protein
VELNAPDQAPIAMVLDAKSTTRFDRDSLWKPSDYRSRVVDPVSGTQPIRQVFFLHRDERSGTLENIPGYLRGNRMGRTASLIGAVACLPWAGRDLTQILRRFLRTFAPRLDVLDEEPPQLPREPG